VEILKQLQYNPYTVEKQVAIIYLGTNNLIREVPVKNVKAFEETFLQQMEAKYPDVLKEFKKGNLPEDGLKKLVKLAQDLIPQFKK
jgi:F-type H+-transporting ATPase subunit alpha